MGELVLLQALSDSTTPLNGPDGAEALSSLQLPPQSAPGCPASVRLSHAVPLAPQRHKRLMPGCRSAVPAGRSPLSSPRFIVPICRSMIASRRSTVATRRSVVAPRRSTVATCRSIAASRRSTIATCPAMTASRRSTAATCRSTAASCCSIVDTCRSMAALCRSTIATCCSTVPLCRSMVSTCHATAPIIPNGGIGTNANRPAFFIPTGGGGRRTRGSVLSKPVLSGAEGPSRAVR